MALYSKVTHIFLKDYRDRQEKRQELFDQMEEEREKKKEKQLDTLIGIFAKLAEKPN